MGGRRHVSMWIMLMQLATLLGRLEETREIVYNLFHVHENIPCYIDE